MFRETFTPLQERNTKRSRAHGPDPPRLKSTTYHLSKVCFPENRCTSLGSRKQCFHALGKDSLGLGLGFHLRAQSFTATQYLHFFIYGVQITLVVKTQPGLEK